MKIYHFSLGNSSKGAVGFCVEVKAKSKKRALELVKDFIGMWEDGLEITIPDEVAVFEPADEGILYGNVYFNSEAITAKDIDEVRDEE